MAKSHLPRVPFAAEVVPIMKSSIVKFHKVQDDIVRSVTPETACFDNVVRPWARVSNDANTANGMIWLLMYAAHDEATHHEISEATKLFDGAKLAWTGRKDLFDLFKAVAEKNEPLDEESRHLVDAELQDFLDAGHGSLTPPDLEEYARHRSRLDDLKKEYNDNLLSEKGGLWISEEDLQGVPIAKRSKWDRGLDRHQGKRFVPFANGGSNAILMYAEKDTIRKRMYLAEKAKAPENIPLFRETILLRDSQARLLGYKNHAAFRIRNRAISSVEYVERFLNSLRDSLVPLGREELRELQALRTQDRKGPDFPQDDDETARIPPWDVPFYKRKASSASSIDEDEIAAFFPLNSTIQAMLRLFEACLELRFIQIPADKLEKDTIWHRDVQVWEVWRASEQTFVGFLYFDLLSRERKYKGSQNVNIHCGYEKEDGTRQAPATVLMCSFPTPNNSTCVQLKHSEVVTLFHGKVYNIPTADQSVQLYLLSPELGHGIHDLVSETKYSRFHGTRLPVDIGEVPSTMLENWCWDKDVLKELSCHYTYLSQEYLRAWQEDNHGKPVPPRTITNDLLERIIENRNTYRGMYHLYQLTVSLFDLIIHNPITHDDIESLDLVKLWYDLREELEGQDFSLARMNCHQHATFGHLINGYDMGYYGYLSCAAFSKDIYLARFANAPKDRETWRSFETGVLKYGGSHLDQLQMLEDFLGRRLNFGALVQGLTQ